jgi:formylglycine-generating enzyme required for sulfatase activity
VNRKWMAFLCCSFAMNVASAGKDLPVWKEPLTGMEFVKIPKGCYQMGNAKAIPHPGGWEGTPLSYLDKPFVDETPQHEVCIDSFWIGRHEVREADWQRVMGGTEPTRPNAPKANLTWEDAQAFASKLSGDGHKFRLPTEAEWEYACRAGKTAEPIPTDDDIVDIAWYVSLQQKDEVQEVGKLAKNGFGLHDMLGNVWEWTEDGYRVDAYKTHPLYNPAVRAGNGNRVIRGGSYRTQVELVRCAKRSHYPANDRLGTIGVRLVRTP